VVQSRGERATGVFAGWLNGAAVGSVHACIFNFSMLLWRVQVGPPNTPLLARKLILRSSTPCTQKSSTRCALFWDEHRLPSTQANVCQRFTLLCHTYFDGRPVLEMDTHCRYFRYSAAEMRTRPAKYSDMGTAALYSPSCTTEATVVP